MATVDNVCVNLRFFKSGQNRLRPRLAPLEAVPGREEDLGFSFSQKIQRDFRSVRQSCHKFVGQFTAQQLLNHWLWVAPSIARITGGLVELTAGAIRLAALPDKHNALLLSTYVNIEWASQSRIWRRSCN